MGTPQKFLLPSPNFNKKITAPLAIKPHFLTPSGMTLHARHQPPPMYGKRGATYPGKFLQPTQTNNKPNQYLPEPVLTEPQFCEACDMELQSLDDLRRHKKQHEKCPVDNCNYRGHPSIMDKHVSTLHSSGLFDKFKKLSTPEEVATWRAERKRKYPTLENCLLRQRAKEQRQKRGERLEGNKSKFGKYDDRKRAQNNTRFSGKTEREKITQHPNSNQRNLNTNRNNNKRRRKEEKQKLEEKKQNAEIEKLKATKKLIGTKSEIDQDEQKESCDGVNMFKGTSALSSYQHIKPKKSKETNVLSSLLGMYGSDEDAEEDSNKDESDEEHAALGLSISEEDKINHSNDILNGNKKSLESSSNQTLEVDVDKNQVDVAAVKNDGIVESENSLELLNKSTYSTDVSKCDVPDIETSLKLATHKSNDELCTDSGDDPPEEAPIAHSTDFQIPSKRAKPNEISNNDPSNSSTHACKKTNQNSRMHKQKSGLDYRKARLRKQNTLLEKLLEPDIRHERNVLLQCVRYVCENNFFGIGQKKE